VWIAGGAGLLVLVVGVVLIILVASGGLVNRITAANYARLHHGMTEPEVIAILGTPTEVGDPNDAFGPNPFGVRVGNVFNFRLLKWRRGSSQIIVGLTNNSVSMLSGTNLP
jgi:hypothetical protein